MENSEVLLRVGLVLYSWVLASPKPSREPVLCADCGFALQVLDEKRPPPTLDSL